MSSRKSETITPLKRRLAKAERRAWNKWGFGGDEPPQAYTYADFARDVESGHIVMPDHERRRGCPVHDPAENCRPARVPPYMRSSWTQREPSAASGRHHRAKAMVYTATVTICEDCRIWIWELDRRRFIAEHGEYRLEQMALDVRHNAALTLVEAAEIIRCMEERFMADYRAVSELAGKPAEGFTPGNAVYEVAVLLSSIRHCLGRYGKPTPGRECVRTSKL